MKCIINWIKMYNIRFNHQLILLNDKFFQIRRRIVTKICDYILRLFRKMILNVRLC